MICTSLVLDAVNSFPEIRIKIALLVFNLLNIEIARDRAAIVIDPQCCS